MGLFGHHYNSSSSSSNHTCPALPQPLSVVGSIHKPFVYVCAACLIAVLVLCVSLIIAHLAFYSVAAEQRQIIRIICTPIVLCVVSLLSVIWYNVYNYIKPISDIYEAVGLSSLFLLFLQYLNPSGTFGPELFTSLAAQLGKEGSHNFPRVKWIMAFQFLLIAPILLVVTDATQAAGVFCAQSQKPYFANLWVTLIRTFSLTAAIISLVRMYKSTKPLMTPHKAGRKFVTFKMLITLDILQTWIIKALVNHNVLKPNATLSYSDLLYGVPAVLLALEAVLFALMYWWAFNPKEYRHRRKQNMNFFRAMLDAMNFTDLIKGIFRTFVLLGNIRKPAPDVAERLPSHDPNVSMEYTGYDSRDSDRHHSLV